MQRGHHGVAEARTGERAGETVRRESPGPLRADPAVVAADRSGARGAHCHPVEHWFRNAPPEGIQFDNLSGDKGYRAFSAYGQSKLANALFSRELARRYAGTNVSSNAVHPGMVATNLGRYITGKPRDPDAPLRKGFKTPEQGASTQVYVAADPRLADVSGYYFEDCNPVVPTGPHMQDDALALRLWEVSEELTAGYLA